MKSHSKEWKKIESFFKKSEKTQFSIFKNKIHSDNFRE